MSCAACQARVEKAVSGLEGVEECNVNLLTNSMAVKGNVSETRVIKAVEDAGYGAKSMNAAVSNAGEEDGDLEVRNLEEALRDTTTPQLKKRLFSSVGVLVILLYFSIGHMMFGFPLPAFLKENCVSQGILQMLLAGIILIINRKFFTSGFSALLHKAPNMDTLIALGSSTAYAYSTVVVFLMSDAQNKGNAEAAMGWMNDLYFESAAMIVTLITVGKMLESYSKGKTTNALKSLMELSPNTATVIRDGKEEVIAASEIRLDDIFIIRAGESIPVDGVVMEGEGAVDESAITGESIPVDKTAGEEVSSGTINRSGYLKCRAIRVGKDTTLSQIIRLVRDAASTKAPVAKLADTISGYFVPAVIAIALVTFIVWLLLGADPGYALARGISVLVVSCPCALGLATPVAIMVGNGVGAGNGILFKTAESLQLLGQTGIVALDKTGTITTGEPAVTDLWTAEGVSKEELIVKAAMMEERSEHPLAKAVTAYRVDEFTKEREACEKRYPVTAYTTLPGNGLILESNDTHFAAGNLALMKKRGIRSVTDPKVKEAAKKYASEGKTTLYFAINDHLLGLIAVADTVKEDSIEAIRELKKMGVHTVMVTGDHPVTAATIAEKVGVDEVAAGVRPEGKVGVVETLGNNGKVAMVGDGINDAPALTRADIGIAIGAGTDVAIDAADVVLMKSSLMDVAAAIRLSRATYRNILENLFWALIYNTILIPVAAGAFVWAGVTMNPTFGAAAMSLSSVCVVTNALRLNLLKIKDAKHDKKIRNAIDKNLLDKTDVNDDNEKSAESITEGGIGMEKTIEIKGMMCAHCEATVKKALERIDGVESAEVSHEKGTAIVTLSAEVEDEELKKAVEDKDYDVVGIK